MPVEGINLDQLTDKDAQLFPLRPRILDSTLGNLLIPKQITVLHGTERAPMSIIGHSICLAAARSGTKAVYLDSGNNYSHDVSRQILNSWKAPREVIQHLSVAQLKDLHYLDEVVRETIDDGDCHSLHLLNLTHNFI